MAVVVEREDAKHFLDALSGLPCRQIAKLRNHGQVFDGRKMRVEIWLLGHVTEAAFVSHQVVFDGLALEDDVAC